ncbi:hypothetical protein MMC14_009387 [Varicellaria rhodocarpa]|nr:hypothetical protein [Varicellaria rhodocarpa]
MKVKFTPPAFEDEIEIESYGSDWPANTGEFWSSDSQLDDEESEEAEDVDNNDDIK